MAYRYFPRPYCAPCHLEKQLTQIRGHGIFAIKPQRKPALFALQKRNYTLLTSIPVVLFSRKDAVAVDTPALGAPPPLLRRSGRPR